MDQPCPCGTPGCVNADNTLCIEHMAHKDATGAYRVRGECWHVYQTAEDLWATARKEYKNVPVYAVYSCPLCAHDF